MSTGDTTYEFFADSYSVTFRIDGVKDPVWGVTWATSPERAEDQVREALAWEHGVEEDDLQWLETAGYWNPPDDFLTQCTEYPAVWL